MLTISNLSVGYKKQGAASPVKEKLNLTGNKGELVALIGPNGVGKSTLLKTLAGFIPPLAGKMELFHANTNVPISFEAKTRAKHISFVSAKPSYPLGLTVFEYIAMGRFPYTNWLGLLSNTDIVLVHNAAKQLEIFSFLNKQIAELSDGEKQRASIARALVQDTPILLFDEPTAFLDLSHKYEVAALLKKMAIAENKLIIYSTHDLHVALKQTDKIWLLGKNHVFQGSPEDLALQEAYNKLFDNKNVIFDDLHSDFVMQSKPKATVTVLSKDSQKLWLSRALNRNGFQVIVSDNPDYCAIWQANEEIIFYSDKINIKAPNIHSLFEQLKETNMY